MPTLHLPKQEALDLLYGDHETATVVLDEITEKGRWSVNHKLVFTLGGKYYKGMYSEGATEYQEQQPWEHIDPVKFTEVEPYEKTVTDYRPVD